jgi:hypothetical protein
MTQILIAHRDTDVAQDIEDTLARRLGTEPMPGPLFNTKHNGSHALAALDAAPTAVAVVELDLPLDRRSGPTLLGGLHFAEATRARHPTLPLVFVAPFTSAELSTKIESLGNASLVLEGSSFDHDLQSNVLLAIRPASPAHPSAAAATAASAPAAKKPRVRYVIELVLRKAPGDEDRYVAVYRVKSIGDPNPYRNELDIYIEPEHIQQLKADTAALQTSTNWKKEYQAIGERLFTLMLTRNFEIGVDLGRLDQRIRDRGVGSDIAICFIVDKAVYPIAFEALHDVVGQNRKFWLERAPVWRQLGLPAREKALFQDESTQDGPIDCLIVEADAVGRIEPWALRFDPLPSVRAEADWLAGHLGSQSGVRIGRIGRIRHDNGRVRTEILQDGRRVEEEHDAPFAKVLENILTAGTPWHLVHYAGHSHYDANRERGWLLLPGLQSASGEAPPLEQIGAATFAEWLQHTRLIVMSSCYGSSQAFVYNLCEYQVAAVTGFRWTIGDHTAGVHSRRFYEELFRRRSIEDALRETWKYMYDSHYDDRVWISSELVMQYAT